MTTFAPTAKQVFLFLGITLLLCFCILGAFWIGHYPISTAQYYHVVRYGLGLDYDALALENIHAAFTILYDIRLPRIVAAVLIGAALSVSGAVFQGIFVNPLVSPGILGVLSGASFGAALGMLGGHAPYVVQLWAFGFGFVAVFVALGIAKFYGKNNTVLMLVLGGVISSSLFGALLSLVKYIADPYNALPSIVYWLMGSLALVNIQGVQVAAPIMVVSMLILIAFSKHINVLSLGEEDAKALGVSVEKIRFILIVLATLLSAISVMLAGIIGWVGLVVPHIARFLVGANHVVLLPFCALLGAVFLLVVDSLSRGVFSVEVPLGILTALIGIPVFILALQHTARR
ncbi:MAG: iron ABC transporter permease [Campylobacterales bacterium]|nr:iron ABC transporter permease [Campylobacterales bacterium]